MKKIKLLFNKIRKDSIGGNLISAAILTLLSVLYNLILSLKSDVDFLSAFKTFWNYEIKLWQTACFVLVFITLFQILKKIRNSKTKEFKYDNDTLTIDKNLYLKIIKEFLSQKTVLDLRNQTFSSNSFEIEKIDWIHILLEESKKSDFVFFNPSIEILKNNLIDKVAGFQSILGSNIFGAGQGWVGVPREWDRERFYKAANEISSCEKEICEDYDSFIITCRTILKV